MIALEASGSGISYVVLALLSGVLVTAGFLLPEGEPKKLKENLMAVARRLIIVFLAISALALLVQGANLQGGALPSGETLRRYLTMTQSGNVWLYRESYAIALLVITIWLAQKAEQRTGVRLAFFLALALLASRSLTSHAVAVREDTAVAVAADAVHLVVAGLWGGGLLAIAWILYYGIRESALPMSWAAEAVRRFSLLAMASVAVLFLTGFYQSWIQVGGLNVLFTTGYGRVLIAKLSLVLVMAALGALNLLSTKPRLIRAVRENREALPAAKIALGRIAAESSLALLVFFVTGLLTALPPGVHAVHQTGRGNAAHTATPELQPAEGASVKIVSPKEGQVITGDRVPLAFKLVKGKRGQHVHAYVDGELMGMFASQKGTLNGVKPGRHTLELRVVAADHVTELNATDKISFATK